MNEAANKLFESGFLSKSLDKQIEHCDDYELAPLFLRLFLEKQPVLEAGCGSGRWCGWFQKHFIKCDGIDWSKELCDRASLEIPQSEFTACDIKNAPFPDGSYAGIVALGSIEHTAEGPQNILKEFNRLLCLDGVAVITVPYGGKLRILLQSINNLLLMLKSLVFVRQLFGKAVGGTSLQQAQQVTNPKWHPRFAFDVNGWSFFEYEFNKHQMRTFLAEAGFDILEESVGFGNEGILHNFGRLAGKWNADRAD
ncbi:MAG: class I SAM-dependent methyltransferase, partial [Pedobacter sp.]